MIRLNPNHDIDALAATFAQRRRMQIRDFLVEEHAESVYEMLLTETPWWTAFNDGEKVAQLPPELAAQLTQQQAAEIQAGIFERARTGYQFLYQYYPLYSQYFDPKTPWLPLFEAYEFVNSPEVLGFFRRLTGRDDIRWADGHATLYRAGHFLKYHTDENPADRRVAAYVLSLTKNWGRDWGGFLQFFDEKFDIEEGLRPIFNALNIFLIPADHSVSWVANYAPGLRFSITGWLRADNPPGDFNRLRP
jgi:SM-20-related protein